MFNDAITHQAVTKTIQATPEHDKAVTMENSVELKNVNQYLSPVGVEKVSTLRLLYSDWLDKLSGDELSSILRTNYKVVPKMTSGLFTKW